MYSIDKLTDKDFMLNLFWKKRKLIDERIKKFISLDLKKIKFYEDKKFKHAVIHYNLRFYDNVNWQQYLNIYASAHSDGSRKRSFKFMEHIHKNGFDLDSFYSSTKPLFYYRPLRASFHQELMGENLRFIIDKYPNIIDESLAQAGKCLAHFHKIPFPKNLKMKKYPFSRKFLDPSNIIRKQVDLFPEEIDLVEKTYKKLEKFYLAHQNIFGNEVFAHGDFHFENILIGTDFEKKPLPFQKVGIIDYTDVCRADRGLDLGSFSQKIDFITSYKLGYDEKESQTAQNLFLKNYLETANIIKDNDLETAINFWRVWNNLRVLINYFLFPKKTDARKILKSSLIKYSEKLFNQND